MSCSTDFEHRVELYLWDELSSSERHALEDHLGFCADCRNALEEARCLEQLVGLRTTPEPSPELLVSCRQALAGALDRERSGWRRLLGGWGPAALRPSRVLAASVLIIAGFALGWALRQRAPHVESAAALAARDRGAPPALGRIAGITQISADPGTNSVSIGLDAERHVTLQGSVGNPRIRRVLIDAMKNYSNPGIRLDTLDALRPAAGDPGVQQAMLGALRHDPNAGVRLQAVQSVEGAQTSRAVDIALAGAVQDDSNPGVRVAATDALVRRALAAKDGAVVPMLRSIAEGGADTYSRMTALAALRQLGQ